MTGYTRDDVVALQNTGEVVVLDVRSPEEFAVGSVAGARNVPVDGLRDEATRLAPEAVVVTVCTHGGRRSQGAAELLRELGFPNASHLVGGVTGA